MIPTQLGAHTAPESHPTRIQSSICYKSIPTVALLHRRNRWIGQEKSSWSWSTTIFCSLYGAWLVATRYSSATSGGQLSGPLSGRSCCVYGVNLEDLIWNKFYFSTTTVLLRILQSKQEKTTGLRMFVQEKGTAASCNLYDSSFFSVVGQNGIWALDRWFCGENRVLAEHEVCQWFSSTWFF